MGAVEENGCEHEGLRFDKERIALVPGRIGSILLAMIVCISVEKGLEHEMDKR